MSDKQEVVDINRRIQIAQKCAPVFGFIGAAAYIINAVVFLHASDILQNTIYISSLIVIGSIAVSAYKNVSFVVLKRLFTEVNVIMVFIYATINTILDTTNERPDFVRHVVMGYIYLVVVVALILVDAFIIKTRAFVLTFALAFSLLTSFNLFGHTFLWDKGVVLFYDINNDPVYKASTKRWVFSQLLLFTFKGLKILIQNNNSKKYLLFVTGNVYRDTEKTEASLTSSNKFCNETIITNTDSEFGTATNNSIVLPRDNKNNDKNEIDIEMMKIPSSLPTADTNQSITSSIRRNDSLGHAAVTSNSDKESISFAKKQRLIFYQRASAFFSGIGFLLYFLLIYLIYPSFGADHIISIIFITVMCVSGCAVFACIGFMVYKNISIRIMKLLLKEFNVLIILTSALVNLCMECFMPMTPTLSPITAFIFLCCVCTLVTLDAMIIKSKIFVLVYGFLFSIITLSVIYQNSFGTNNDHIVLFHGVGGSTFYKRYVKRTIFIQIFTFAFRGLWTIALDTKMEFMMFCTSPVFESTGTTSLRHFAPQK